MSILGAVVRVRPQHLDVIVPRTSALPGVDLALNPGDGYVLADACEELGLRALLCYGASERNGGRDEAEQGLAECARFLRSNDRPLVRGLVGLHASFTVSDQTLRDAARLGWASGAVVHVHVAEDRADVEDAWARGFTGPLERLLALAAPPEDMKTVIVGRSPALSEHFVVEERAFDQMLRARNVAAALQPIVRVTDGRLRAFEVLGRGRAEGLPDSPMGLFGLAMRLGREVELSEAFRWAGLTTAAALAPEATLFVNAHPKEMFQEAFYRSIALLRAMVPTASLVVEVHERQSEPVGQLSAHGGFPRAGHADQCTANLHRFGYGSETLRARSGPLEPEFTGPCGRFPERGVRAAPAVPSSCAGQARPCVCASNKATSVSAAVSTISLRAATRSASLRICAGFWLANRTCS